MRRCGRVRWSPALRWIAVIMISLGFTLVLSLRVAHAASPVISTVTFGGTTLNPTITINGSGFGASAPAMTATGGCIGPKCFAAIVAVKSRIWQADHPVMVKYERG